MSLSIGAEFAGYTVQRPLGTGGMGEVYLVQHPRLPRLDALKILPPDLTGDSEFRQRFNREADLAATLWHPHIVGVHDRGEHHGQLWISMDFVDGTDAAQLLRTTYQNGMPANEALEILDALAEALDYAHEKGLLHRDVKPANILLTTPDKGRRRILLTDFGIARQADDISGLTATNMTIGTVSYASPEQLSGGDVDGRSDQYSLAITAYELLTGATPFVHSNPAVVIGKHLSAEAPPISDRRPELTAVDATFARALSKQPPARFATCQEFASEVRTALGAEAVGSEPSAAAQAESTDASADGGLTAEADVVTVEGVRPEAPTQLAAGSLAANETVPALLTASEPDTDSTESETSRHWAVWGVPAILVVLLIVAAAFPFQTVRTRQAATSSVPEWQPYVNAAQTMAKYLTTFDYRNVDRDVQRVLDNSSGTFLADFRNRSETFKQSVRDAKSSSEGTVTGAGLEAMGGDNATVLVAVTVKATQANQPNPESRAWRMRLIVQKDGDTYTTSDVEFVQ